jgi:hypothetical protein
VAAFARPEQLLPAAKAALAADLLVLTTGFPVAAVAGGFQPETDGPGGAFAIGELRRRLGLPTRYAVDAGSARLLEGLGAAPLDVLDLPPGAEGTPALAAEYLQSSGARRLLAVERPGRAEDGHYYTMRARPITEAVAALDELFLAAGAAGVETIAIGDGGNEVGMGALRERVTAAVPHGEQIASIVPADVVVVAGVSTWGAYGVVAAASCLQGENLLPTLEEERERVEALLAVGAVDGVTGERVPSIDGLPLEVTLEVLAAARGIVDQTIR